MKLLWNVLVIWCDSGEFALWNLEINWTSFFFCPSLLNCCRQIHWISSFPRHPFFSCQTIWLRDSGNVRFALCFLFWTFFWWFLWCICLVLSNNFFSLWLSLNFMSSFLCSRQQLVLFRNWNVFFVLISFDLFIRLFFLLVTSFNISFLFVLGNCLTNRKARLYTLLIIG